MTVSSPERGGWERSEPSLIPSLALLLELLLHFLPAQPTPLQGSRLPALALLPDSSMFRPGCDPGPVFVSTYGPGVVGWEPEMITSNLGWTHS